jgi:hypothetical protein
MKVIREAGTGKQRAAAHTAATTSVGEEQRA